MPSAATIRRFLRPVLAAGLGLILLGMIAPSVSLPVEVRVQAGSEQGRHTAAAQGAAEPSVGATTGDSWGRRLARRLEDFLRDLGPWAPAAFVALFVVTSVLCIPGAFLTIAGGALFGVGWGFVYVWLGCVLGASAAFLVSRHVARNWVMRRLAGRPLLLAIEEAVTQEGWKIVVLTRLAPGSPFFLLNYLYGLTRVRFWPYIVATAISLIPGTFLFVYLGSLGQMALAGRLRTPWEWAFYGVGLVALFTAVALIANRSKKVLNQKLKTHTGTAQKIRPEEG